MALVTALGGGTIRDICLGATPVFWISDWRYGATSVVTGVGTFWLVRQMTPLLKYLELADAFALALFTIVGAGKSLPGSGVRGVQRGDPGNGDGCGAIRN